MVVENSSDFELDDKPVVRRGAEVELDETGVVGAVGGKDVEHFVVRQTRFGVQRSVEEGVGVGVAVAVKMEEVDPDASVGVTPPENASIVKNSSKKCCRQVEQ